MNAAAFPVLVIHGIADARRALAAVRTAGGNGVTLLSAPAAACFMGPAWWRALVSLAAAEHPTIGITDLLDCGDAAGRALEALRLGQRQLVLAWSCRQRTTVLERAGPLGAIVHGDRPAALDLADRDAERRLRTWLASGQAGPTP